MMKHLSRLKHIYLATVSAGMVFVLPLIVQASGGGPGAHIDEVEGIPKGDLVELIKNLIQAGLGLVGAVALAFFIYGGFIYITSGGDEKSITRGKQIMVYAVLGIVAIGFSYVVIEFVIGALGGGGGLGN